jgi:hypothetical protein
MPADQITKSGALKINWDKLGMSLSLLCAIHCLAMPFVITLLPLAGAAFNLDLATELLLIGSSIVLSGTILYKDYRRHHHSFRPLGVLIAAVLLITLLHLVSLPLSYKWLESSGGILLFVAFLVNRKYMKAHHTCAVHQ